MNVKGFISVMKLRASGDKGWYRGNCPYCSTVSTFGVIFITSGYGDKAKKPHYHCYSAKCGKSGSINDLARKINRPDLVDGDNSSEEKVEVKKEAVAVTLPVGFRRRNDIKYLLDRGVTVQQMDMYEFGTTRIHPDFKDYVILSVKDGDKLIGYVARIMMSKDQSEEMGLLRYRNSGTDFGSTVLGINEINDETRVVIAVEGAYDKFAIDRKLDLYASSTMKCVCTLGTKLSETQAQRIKDKGKSVNTLIIMYDEGVVNKSKVVGGVASSYFDKILVASLTGGDPDEASKDQILDAISSARSLVEYSLHELDTNRLQL